MIGFFNNRGIIGDLVLYLKPVGWPVLKCRPFSLKNKHVSEEAFHSGFQELCLFDGFKF